MDNRYPDDDLHWRVSLSAAALLWERLWRAVWPALAVLGLFGALVLLDLLPMLPGWLHALVLGGFALAVAGSLWRELSRLRLPGRGEARRRLERGNRLDHRPLETLRDHVVDGANADRLSHALWRRHLEQVRQRIGDLKVGMPAPRLIRRDPLAIRFGLAMLLLLALIAAGADAPARLARALMPEWGAAAAAVRSVALDAWIAPPAYTGQPPVFLAGAARGSGYPVLGAAISVPQGSVLVAQVSGAGETPAVEAAGAADPAPVFEAFADDSFRTRLTLERDGRVTILDGGRELGAWDITVVWDAPPVVSFLAEPGQTVLGAVRIDFEAYDDYALVGVKAVIRRPDSAAGADETITFELPLPGVNASEAIGTGYQDLTPHPWAGLEVRIHLTARDGRGQQGTSGALSMILPERVFQHPVARAIVEQRKRLTADPQGARDSVGAELRAIAWRTDAYDDDIVVFMALTTASRRIKYSHELEALAEIQSLLWDTALRVEDGKVSMASRELRRLQQELMEALANDAPDEELERLLDELQAALDELLDALAAMQMPPRADGMPFDPDTLTLDRQDLQAMIERLRDLMKSGARDAAREMLAQLQNLLENLQTGQMAQQQEGFSEAMNMLNALQELILGQKELLDRTFAESQRRGQQGAPPPQQPRTGEGKGDSADTTLQEALRRQLGELMRQLGEMTGEIPRPFGRAEGAMRRSTEGLRADRPGEAVGPQTEALDQLQQGARMATEQLMQQFGGMPGQARGRPGRRQFGQQDPFGRTMDGVNGMNQGGVEIPTESDVQRARRILEELRRRAGERDRPLLERDYIDRLLKKF